MRATMLLAGLIVGLGACGSGENATEPQAANEGQPGEAVEGKMWVTAERIDRHTCPSISCGVVGTLDFREAASVEERKGEWVRITRPYDASCTGNRSEYVDKGKASCTPDNGIVDGKFAEWAEAKHLSVTRPADPAETAASDEQLVKDSDDFTRYRRAFATAARTLIDRGDCTAGDLQENGGFVKSTNQRDAPIYFTYCGGFTTANCIYLNASSGEIFR